MEVPNLGPAGRVSARSSSSRPKKLDTTDKVRLLDAISENPRITREDLLAKVSYKVKIDLIRRLLNTKNLRK